MKDRISANPGRYKITFENEALGTTHAVLELDDNPSVTGTPLNAATLCSGEILFNLGLDDNATPSDVFNVILSKINDTGWQSLWPNNDASNDKTITAKAYADNKSNAPEYRKVGNIIYLRGIVSAKEDMEASIHSAITVGTLPQEVRPSKTVFTVIHGSYGNTALLEIRNDGVISIGRYSNGPEYQALLTSSWLTFNTSFMVD